jgi:hypothetical protein
MKGAIMQPYLFPYIGYYQLAYEVDKFVFLDDVNFIKKGYINRNAVLLQGQRHEFSVPVAKVSQNRHINEHSYTGEFTAFLGLIKQSYSSAPFFKDIWPLVESVVLDADLNVARKNAKSISAVFSYLGVDREFLFSSDIGLDAEYKGQERILALCQNIGIKQYRNAVGGQSLYEASAFNAKEIQLRFIQTHLQPYAQSTANFVPYLSMIDVLMYCDKLEATNLLKGYALD